MLVLLSYQELSGSGTEGKHMKSADENSVLKTSFSEARNAACLSLSSKPDPLLYFWCSVNDTH